LNANFEQLNAWSLRTFRLDKSWALSKHLTWSFFSCESSIDHIEQITNNEIVAISKMKTYSINGFVLATFYFLRSWLHQLAIKRTTWWRDYGKGSSDLELASHR